MMFPIKFFTSIVCLAVLSYMCYWMVVFIGKPGKPRDLKIVSSSENHVTLEWRSPEYDGIFAITQYFVEALDDRGNWRKGAEVPSTPRMISIKDLQRGKVLRFRVVAVNEFGSGEPSNTVLFTVPKQEDGVGSVLKTVGMIAACTAGASAAILGGVALAVPALGFTAAGVSVGSLAAAYQSAILGGTIVSGGAFATLQSIGAAGLAASTKAAIVAATGAASLALVENEPEY